MKRTILILLLLGLAAALSWAVMQRLSELGRTSGGPGGERPPAPVEVGPVVRGPITFRRTFSGELEAAAEFIVAPKVAGRLKTLAVDLGDTVMRGQLLATLDDDEFAQAVQQGIAELEVAKASHSEAKSALEIAERALQRAQNLRAQGITTESEMDEARTEELSRRAHVEVTAANVASEEAALETARIRLGYTRVTADWNGGDDRRIVGERFVDEGGTVSANVALLSIVELDPIIAVVNVPERDYARIAIGQRATLSTDSYPKSVFEGEIVRIAPVFRRSTRQARVEVRVENQDERLKPGMFIRAQLELEHYEDALSVPFDSVIERAGQTGIFLLDENGQRVQWRQVEVGLREGERLQVSAPGLSGEVVTLGQELCDDGSPVLVVGRAPAPRSVDAPGAVEASSGEAPLEPAPSGSAPSSELR